MANVLYRPGRWSVKQRRAVLGGWLAILVVAVGRHARRRRARRLDRIIPNVDIEGETLEALVADQSPEPPAIAVEEPDRTLEMTS